MSGIYVAYVCSRWLVDCTWRCGAVPRAPWRGGIQNRAALSRTPLMEKLKNANWSVW